MKYTTNLIALLTTFSLCGCVTTKKADTSAFDKVSEDVLNVAIESSYNGYSKPRKTDAVLALALFKRYETVPEIIRLAQASDNQDFRHKCNNALGWMGQKEAIPYLIESMKTDPYQHARKAAAIALESITGEIYLTPENGFESKEMIQERLKKEMEERKSGQE